MPPAAIVIDCVVFSLTTHSSSTFVQDWGRAQIVSAMLLSMVCALPALCRVNNCHIEFRLCACRVKDYWQGYKLFCFAYYSHSKEHEAEFRHSKLGLEILPSPFFSCLCSPLLHALFSVWLVVVNFGWPLNSLSSTGRFVWQHHLHPPPPSRHAIRNTCMHLLPLVEIFCKWELEEDCTDLVSLMHRFDSQHQLESHEPGRSLLAMLGDEDGRFEIALRHAPIAARPSPFEGVRERLAAAALAIRDLQVQACTLPSSFTV